MQQRQILFECPRTGIYVQQRLDGGSSECSETKGVYLALSCPACGWTHFVDSATGVLLGHGDRAFPSASFGQDARSGKLQQPRTGSAQ